MGGMGSGRRYQGGKDTTSVMRALDIRRLQRDGLLAPGRAFGWDWLRGGKTVASIQIRMEADHVTLNYRRRGNGGEWQPIEYAVYLEWTGLYFGGSRAWFLCPAQGCGRRVAILYGGAIFTCRHCHKLAYECQRESVDDRAIRRADTIRRRLGWQPGIANPAGGKPKGMHWKTFRRLQVQHDDYVTVSLDSMAKRLSLVNRRLAGLRDKLNGGD